jgi:hypothetical protein
VKNVLPRDMVEKKMIFKHENKTYVYFSSVNDEFKEIGEGRGRL